MTFLPPRTFGRVCNSASLLLELLAHLQNSSGPQQVNVEAHEKQVVVGGSWKNCCSSEQLGKCEYQILQDAAPNWHFECHINIRNTSPTNNPTFSVLLTVQILCILAYTVYLVQYTIYLVVYTVYCIFCFIPSIFLNAT